MSDGTGVGLSRRDLLYGLVTAGVGAGTGVASAAVLNDRERFSGNVFSTGRLDLESCWMDGNGSDCTPGGGDGSRIGLGSVRERGSGGRGSIRLRLPDDGPENNPGWIWFRSSCPNDGDGLEGKLCLRIWYDRDCDAAKGGSEEVIASGTLCEVLDVLRGGVLLDGDPATDSVDPLSPGDEGLCLGVEWVLDEPLGSDESVGVDFEFHAAQSRNSDPENPWPDAGCDVDCGGGCSSKAISFVALCGDGGLSAETTGVATATGDDGRPITNDEGEPIAVEWDADAPVDRVVVKTGGGSDALFTFDAGGETSGTARVDTVFDDPAAGADQSPRSPCPDGSGGVKYEYRDGRWSPETE